MAPHRIGVKHLHLTHLSHAHVCTTYSTPKSRPHCQLHAIATLLLAERSCIAFWNMHSDLRLPGGTAIASVLWLISGIACTRSGGVRATPGSAGVWALSSGRLHPSVRRHARANATCVPLRGTLAPVSVRSRHPSKHGFVKASRIASNSPILACSVAPRNAQRRI